MRRKKDIIVETRLKFLAEDVPKARAWERKHHYDYQDDLAHLLIDALSSGKFHCDILEATEGTP